VNAPADHRVVIRLHRLGHKADVFFLNPDLIVSVESTPDTVITLTTHTKVLVSDGADEVVAAVRDWRASILSAALPRRPRRDGGLTLVKGLSAAPPAPPEER
jgi:uncharacterized protein YlzI (FlbEa/FlbD family)